MRNVLILFGVLITVWLSGQGIIKKDVKELSQESREWLWSYNYDNISAKMFYPYASSSDYLRNICRMSLIEDSPGVHYLPEQKIKHFGFTGNVAADPKILKDTLDISQWRKPGTGGIKVKTLFEIDDGFKFLSSIMNIGSNVYFVLPGAVAIKGKLGYGIHRINAEGWHNFVNGAYSPILTDLGKNRVLGYYLKTPMTLYGFDWNFNGSIQVSLPDFRLRQELHKLDERRFLFHNLRLHHSDFAVEIYDISGRRTGERFDYVACHRPTPHRFNLSTRTVLTTDKKGHFFIAFQYPMNPYRVWTFDGNGNKVRVTGYYLDDPDYYESPEELITTKFDDIRYYGLNWVCSIDKLLCDHRGYLYVFVSIQRIPHGTHIDRHFLDVYSPKGKFIGRVPFDYGCPELIHKHIIYSRKKVGKNRWKIYALTLTGVTGDRN